MLSRILQRFPMLVWAPVRFTPMVAAIGYVALSHGPIPAHKWDWVLALISAACTIFGGRFPLAVTLAQSVLTVLAIVVLDAVVANAVIFALAAIALGELAMRRTGWQCWVGIAGYVAAQVVVFLPGFHPLLTPFTIALATVPAVVLGGYIRSVLRRAVEVRRQREIAVREARAAERTAIARELHDLVAHYLASVAMGVGAARIALGEREPAVAIALSDVHTTTSTALTDLRKLVATLRDPASINEEAGTALIGDDGFTGALAGTVERARNSGLVIDAEIDKAITTLDSMRRLAVLRVVQEGLTNVIKHAGRSATARLRVSASPEEVRIEIVDDGAHSTITSADNAGFGLVGLRERVEVLGGGLLSEPAQGGWRLAAWMPNNAGENIR
ncbi:histidine kinase [Saccharomonospora sp. NPDC006951]